MKYSRFIFHYNYKEQLLSGTIRDIFPLCLDQSVSGWCPTKLSNPFLTTPTRDTFI